MAEHLVLPVFSLQKMVDRHDQSSDGRIQHRSSVLRALEPEQGWNHRLRLDAKPLAEASETTGVLQRYACRLDFLYDVVHDILGGR